MPVEIRELVIQTHIAGGKQVAHEALSAEKIAQLKKQIVQECLWALRDKAAKNGFDR